MRKIEKNHGTRLTKYQHMMVQKLNEPTPSKSHIKIWPFISIQSTHSPPSAKSWVQRPLGAIGLTVVGLRQSTVQLRRAQQRIAERSKVQLTRLVPHIRVKKNKSLFKTFNVEDVMQATIGEVVHPTRRMKSPMVRIVQPPKYSTVLQDYVLRHYLIWLSNKVSPASAFQCSCPSARW